MEVAYCHTPNGQLRIWVEHWHSDAEVMSPSDAGTMLIRDNLAPGTPTTEVTADGFIRDTDSGSLPGCGTPTTEVQATVCSDKNNYYQDNWVYFDYPISCNVPVDVTLLEGTTQVLEGGCTAVYPATISQTFLDSASPELFFEGYPCVGDPSGWEISAVVNSCGEMADIYSYHE